MKASAPAYIRFSSKGQIVIPAALVTLPITRSLADQAAEFKAAHKISLADAFAAAPAKERDATLVTGDAEFKPLAREIRIKWLRG
jgi:predicted nucleic acid-binding protein